MSDIEHHAWRGGLNAALGYDEFAPPTSSGEQLTRPTAIAFRSGCDPPTERRRRGRTTLSRRGVAAW
jgi:hypothetical protein